MVSSGRPDSISMVIISWPYQAIGFAKDILYFGLAGKPV